MFEPSDSPRIFTVPLGMDFPKSLVEGLQSRLANDPPEATARVELFVNTRRMERRLNALLTEYGARFLPKIQLITDLATSPGLSNKLQPVAPLARRLELRQLVRQLLQAQPNLAPIHTALDHADTLTELIAEMHGEGVSLGKVLTFDHRDHAEHWQQAVKFLEVIAPFFDDETRPSLEARQRAVVENLIARWRVAPPTHPVLIAGSTGSRGTTALLIQAVAKLPQGAVILPGFDAEMPMAAWQSLEEHQSQDHPQYRNSRILRDAGLDPSNAPGWTTTRAPNTARARLVSLALRPAPVTDAWLTEGPQLENLDVATSGIALLEADTSRDEAMAIATRLRQALEDGKRAAVITPDRNLTRRITAALDRWSILPDDSAGLPLHQSPAGRLLRQIAELLGKQPDPTQLLALLKHPHVAFGPRGPHLKHARDLELGLLRGGAATITAQKIKTWADKLNSKSPDPDWLTQLCQWLDTIAAANATTLSQWTTHVRDILTMLTSKEWTGSDVDEAQKTLTQISEASSEGGRIKAFDFAQILSDMLSRGEVRDATTPHPDIMIWGTLEARVQGADLVILAGLNEGIWPEAPAPDPWLNRAMRKEAGLFLPERQIGLSAHDFQQAFMAPEVLITRAKRDAEAETVPSRWLNRLTSLLDGLAATGAPALKAMRERGTELHQIAKTLDKVTMVDPAERPSPIPPLTARPNSLSVTRIEWLIRDPYAIYARYVLGLTPLDPLTTEPTPALRGNVLHDVMERFVKSTASEPTISADALLSFANSVFENQVEWPAIRALWLSRFRSTADWFEAWENAHRQTASPKHFEVTGARTLPALDFTLSGRADRIDLGPTGISIFDYKSGAAPTQRQEKFFNKQLPLLAAIAVQGGFKDVAATSIAEAGFLLIGTTPGEAIRSYTPEDLDTVWQDLITLLTAYTDPEKGYTARRAVEESRWDQPYDHLARYGEWSTSLPAKPRKVGQ